MGMVFTPHYPSIFYTILPRLKKADIMEQPSEHGAAGAEEGWEMEEWTSGCAWNFQSFGG